MENNPISILVIDGDVASCNYLAVMLSKAGHKVTTASLGREGLIAAWKDRPEIIILDPVLPDISAIDLVKRLRQDRRTSNVPYIALSSRENSQEMSELLAAGCSEYLVKSSPALQKILELIPRLLKKELPPQKRGKLIAFLSAKGGTGTSSLCANIAMSMASEKKDKKIAVIDMVLPIGSIASIVGYNERMNLVTVAALKADQTTASYFMEELPLASGWYFHLLAGAPDPETANQLNVSRLDDIVKAILEAYDYVFVDLGRSLSRISLPIIQKANLIVLILGTDLATCSLSLVIWEYLKRQGVDQQRVYAMQNRSVGLEGLTRIEAEKMIGLPIRTSIPYMGGNFTAANNRHEPIISQSLGGSSVMMIQQAAKQIYEMVQKPVREK